LDPENLVKKAKPVAPEKPYEAPRSFNEFPIDATLKRALHNRGFKVPTEIQERSIEAVLEGHNVLGIANTGTGKTAAFLLPILNNLLERPQHFHALVLVPTRELALQVFEEYNAFTKDIQLFAQKFIGGTSVNEDMRRLRKRPHVVIGTPGRIADLVDRGALPMDKFEVLVLDEFDRMLDMGFSQEVQRLVGQMTRRKQSLLFSATIDNGLQRLIDELVPESVKIQVSSGTTSSETIDQDVVRVGSNENKLDTLVAMLQHEDFTRVMVFAETKHRVSRLCRDLKKAGVRADEIHGDKSQNARQIALDKFKKGYVQVLCATDVAARGIDVDNVSHVINFEVPRTYDSYIHRIGRTGRAGKTGKALTFVEK
jgi:ATP-dependent RNA helicase RhlE